MARILVVGVVFIAAPCALCGASSLFDAPVYKTYGKLIIAERFEPAGFAAPLGYKGDSA